MMNENGLVEGTLKLEEVSSNLTQEGFFSPFFELEITRFFFLPSSIVLPFDFQKKAILHYC